MRGFAGAMCNLILKLWTKRGYASSSLWNNTNVSPKRMKWRFCVVVCECVGTHAYNMLLLDRFSSRGRGWMLYFVMSWRVAGFAG